MFQRRLLVLAGCAVLVNLILAAQLFRLAVVEHDRHHSVAESRLQVQNWLPTWRGAIRDRHGRVLAEDRPAYDVAVAYDVITGFWMEQQATRAAQRALGRDTWNMMGPEERDAAARGHRAQYDETVQGIWSTLAETAGCSEDELDSKCNQIKARVQHMAAVVWERQRQQHEARFEDATDRPTFRARPIAEQEAFHVLLKDVSDAQSVDAQRLAELHPELVQVRYARSRAHPNARQHIELDRSTLPRGLRSDGALAFDMQQVGLQVVGDVRQGVWEEDMHRRPFRHGETGEVDRGGYLLDDEIGMYGLERAQEDRLRGQRGSVTSRRGEDGETRVGSEPGQDIQTTLDIRLQARVEAILSDATGLLNVQAWHGNSGLPTGQPLNAAAVVLAIETGEILAMASAPNRAETNSMTPIERQLRAPWVDRSVEAVYPPGSIVKPLILAAAAAEGVHDLNASITCNGHHYPSRSDIARCWIYRPRYNLATHGALDAPEALARSCNCFFYELGSRLGLERIADWLSYFGAGRRLDVGLTSTHGASVESSGSLPGDDEIVMLHRSGEADFEAVMLAIGQGRFAWTPLHAANAFAILARHGHQQPPTLLLGDARSTELADRPLPPDAVAAILAGLESAVTDSHGTGSRLRYGPGDYEPIFDVAPSRVWGKTGTAQAPPMPMDLDGDGAVNADERVSDLHHAWFVGLVGAQDPEYAVAVLVEYGGSGGRVAGPIANQIMRALMDESYLPPAVQEFPLQ